MAFGRSLHLRLHPFAILAILAALGLLAMIPFLITWKATIDRRSADPLALP
jgi:hypothetical protein